MNGTQPTPQHASTHRAVLRPALIAGCYTGAMLTVTLLGSLVIANRIPALEPYAFERNAVSYALFVVVMILPILRFLNHPVKMFVSAITGWAILAVAYDFSGLYFRNLFDVTHRTPFEILAEGALFYGILSLSAWVCRIILHARRHSPGTVRRSRSGAISGHR